MTLRKAVLKVHLYLGVSAAFFLIVLGLTGSVMAFENDIPHWLHRDLWYVKAGPRVVPEQDLIRAAETRCAPARVTGILFPRHPDIAQAMSMTDGSRVFVNPYEGSIQGRIRGEFASDRILSYIHQVHLRLVPDPRSAPRWLSDAGKKVISFAGLMLCLLVPTGLILFWRTRRFRIKWSASWYRIVFDAHHVVGIYAALFLFVASLTGILIGFELGEEFYYSITHSERPKPQSRAESLVTPDAMPITADRAIGIARASFPDATLAQMLIPVNAKGVYMVLMRVPEDTSEAAHSSVVLDQYSGRVLQTRNFLTDSAGFRAIRFNRSIHTGDIWGTPSHVFVSLSSLALVVMAVTGLVIWWRKLAV
ncbi:MAG TPA: PepSY-associated TM helix domain-containing protein [Bryobacteraceae bacterium]|nr:PepSY-associated TM helix domain-containing protein [Bryobacteraceae bacterium]